MDLLLIRHAESEGNTKNIMQGRTDFSLSREGICQAEYLAKRLEDHNIDIIYTSSLKRALDTAKIIGRYHPGIPIITKEELTEIHIGVFTGLPWSEAKKKYPNLTEECTRTRNLDCVPGAETSEEISKRVKLCVDFILSHKNTVKRMIVISHGGFLKKLLKKLLGIPENTPLSFTLANASVSELFFNDIIRVKKVNCTFHLLEKVRRKSETRGGSRVAES